MLKISNDILRIFNSNIHPHQAISNSMFFPFNAETCFIPLIKK
jgi:hypothetical protein